MKTQTITLFILCILIGFGCTKEAGTGGSATIEGKIFKKELSSSGELEAEYYAPDEDVYIVFGDDNFYGDNVNTHHDGTYQFKFLNKGMYQIYAYSRCKSCTPEDTPVFIEVEITENNQVVVLDDLVIEDK